MCAVVLLVFFFKQKTAYELRISDWSSDVCSSDLPGLVRGMIVGGLRAALDGAGHRSVQRPSAAALGSWVSEPVAPPSLPSRGFAFASPPAQPSVWDRPQSFAPPPIARAEPAHPPLPQTAHSPLGCPPRRGPNTHIAPHPSNRPGPVQQPPPPPPP